MAGARRHRIRVLACAPDHYNDSQEGHDNHMQADDDNQEGNDYDDGEDRDYNDPDAAYDRLATDDHNHGWHVHDQAWVADDHDEPCAACDDNDSPFNYDDNALATILNKHVRSHRAS